MKKYCILVSTYCNNYNRSGLANVIIIRLYSTKKNWNLEMINEKNYISQKQNTL